MLARVFLLFLLLMPCLAAAEAKTPLPVRIGVLTDMSGGMANAAGLGSVEAAQLAVEDLWKTEGEANNGTRQVVVINADYQNRGDLAQHISESWLQEQGVDVVVDVPNAAIAKKLSDLFSHHNRLLFTSLRGPDAHQNACAPHTLSWLYDRRTLTQNLISSLLAEGKKNWYILGNDDMYSTHVTRHAREVVLAGGGKVVGEAQFGKRLQGLDMVLEQIGKIHADIIFLAFDRPDILHVLKHWPRTAPQGLPPLAMTPLFITDVHELDQDGLPAFYTIAPFYWKQDGASQDWARKFSRRNRGAMPTEIQASVYASSRHYLEYISSPGENSPLAIMTRMKASMLNDPLFGASKVRADGLVMHRLHLLAYQPAGQRDTPWDYFKIVRTTPPSALTLPEEIDCRLKAD